MKNLIIAITLLGTIICLSSCTNANAPELTDTDTTSSTTAVQQTTTQTTVKSTTQVGTNIETQTQETTVYRPNSNYESWTFNDWINASDEQRSECLNMFVKEVGHDTDENNLGKIFATNQDKNLTQIIVIQKANTTQQGIQRDPGHGAAAGY